MTDADDEAYDVDLAAGRRIELSLSRDCILTLQYFPEFNNVSMSFYTKNMPGFTIGLPTEDWPLIQNAIAKFNWRGQKQ